ncbi:integrase [Rhodococcus sp. SRB_17]|uniref:DDE-type integrase/transposase/recombinase n=1 Tax=Acidovorax sp. SRB_24 TaxID=1962700 RepID=UPI00145D3D8B|nr:DDE-type integrase/transposase/recombinase [Acidovorax sp. SRB_24]NMM75370.1 integrase [Acidovorax sp. SRB_24]NMM86657.1 integrase [Rhodococcus sp. SRB_17]
MSLNPVIVERLVQVRQAAQAAPRGGKQAIYTAACAELGMSAATLHRQLGKITVKPERKKRSDAGDVSLTRDEAIAISAALMVSHRKTNKRLMSIGQAVDVMRANGEVRAERVDPATGEVASLSDSAIARALRHYNLHPDQLNRPAPAVELKSLHPNHVWQIDASLCVLYYLNARTPAESGLQVMERDKFYKNKPANLKRIEADRVWSYEITCHNSSAIYVQYVMGAESGTNLAECFISAIQKREGDPFHGVPFILMMDMGSANTSGLFTNLARRLQVKTIAHAPGNARATGQVEKARDLIERSFESGLRLRPVRDLAELNAQAQRWARWFNATKIHSRHGKARYDQWMTITAEQLRVAPPVEVCQALLTETPEARKVTDFLVVSYKGREFDVRGVPNVMVGEKLHITLNPWVPDAAMVVDTDEDGNEVLHSIPLVVRNDAGFRDDANVIGEDWARPADTQLEGNRKEVDRFAYDAATDAEAEVKRKAKATPFGGRIDPGKVIDQAPERTFMPRRGTDLAPAITTSHTPLPARLLSPFEASAALVRLGVTMSRETSAQVRAWYPEGVPEDQLQDLQARLTVRSGLRVVAGGAA